MLTLTIVIIVILLLFIIVSIAKSNYLYNTYEKVKPHRESYDGIYKEFAEPVPPIIDPVM